MRSTQSSPAAAHPCPWHHRLSSCVVSGTSPPVVRNTCVCGRIVSLFEAGMARDNIGRRLTVPIEHADLLVDGALRRIADLEAGRA